MAIISAVPAFANLLTIFNTKVSALISTAQEEDLVIRGVTIGKAESKENLCRLCTDIAASIYAFAVAISNSQLKQQVNFSYSELIRTKDDILAPRCGNIKDLGFTNLAGLMPYGITSASLDALEAAIDAYQQKVPAPRNSAAQKITVRQNLRKLFSEADAVLKEQMDKVITGFKTSQPDFVSNYKSNRVIINPGTSVTTLKGKILDAKDQSPISGAAITIPGTAYKAISNEAGSWEIKPIAYGTYTIDAASAKHTANTQAGIKIKQGQTTTLSILLQPIS